MEYVWLQQFNLSNIGGILGIAYDNNTLPYGNSIWTQTNMSSVEFALNLNPGNGWSWIPDAPAMSNQTSLLYLGGLNFEYLNKIALTDWQTKALFLKSTDSTEVIVDTSLMTFGKTTSSQSVINVLPNYQLAF